MNVLKLVNAQFIIVLFLLSMLLSINNNTQLSLFVSIASSLLLIVWTKIINGNYTNITLLFVVFSTLYGVSGPISVVWGEGLSNLFAGIYNVDAFLISYAISNIGLIIGFIIFNLIHYNKQPDILIDEKNLNSTIHIKEKLFKIGIFLIFFSSIFELINILRIGGFTVLFAGKATYQTLISVLNLTLPSTEFMVIGYSLIGIYLGTRYLEGGKLKGLRSKVILFLICSSPFLAIKMILGQRGILISLFLCIFIGITFFRPLKKVKPKIIIVLLVFYFFLSFLFANRSIVKLIPEDPSLFVDMAFNQERLVDALNPGTNEFGAAFGNYVEFYNKYNSNFTPRLGETYVRGLVLPIPSFIYPGTKPQQVTYEFRDEFFISEASRGSIAGTGFSSILEAYMNFKYIGVFLIYLLIGYFLQKCDKFYRNKNLYFMIMYTALFSETIDFHRNAFGTTFSSVFLTGILVFIVYLFLNTKKFEEYKGFQPIVSSRGEK
ncbi:O-antigen ligase [Schinkia azotoformans]|uniref:O-antigen polymerase n=1 Tax=Schinkia azotoformans TaxID=1454 RepID=UPI002E20750B|nr:O-antigen ligase [Schinkia azotoformans]